MIIVSINHCENGTDISINSIKKLGCSDFLHRHKILPYPKVNFVETISGLYLSKNDKGEKTMIKDYLKAGYPALCILTQEPYRAEKLLQCQNWRFYAWDCIQGIRSLEHNKIHDEITNPVEAIRWLNGLRDSVLISHNLHLFLDEPEIIQSIQSGVQIWKSLGCALVMISPIVSMRPEIEKFFHLIELPLPSSDDLFTLQIELGKNINIKPNRKASRSGCGMTEQECESSYAYSLIKKGYFSSKVITEAKIQNIQKTGLLEVWEPTNENQIGGLGNLKKYIKSRAKAFSPEYDHLPKLRGILLVGVSGCGKTLCAKATASILKFPLVRLDVGTLKNSLVGESERRMRQAIKVLQAFASESGVVLLLDEVEKMLAGSNSDGNTDGGTMSGIMSYLLTFMNESKASIVIMATANNIKTLPPEFMRTGRFDTLFYTDLPGLTERLEIIRIMNKKYGSKIPENFAARLNGYSGSEIEQLAKDSLYDDLEQAFNALIPLSRTMRNEIESLREWAKTRARFANTIDNEPVDQRKIRVLKS